MFFVHFLQELYGGVVGIKLQGHGCKNQCTRHLFKRKVLPWPIGLLLHPNVITTHNVDRHSNMTDTTEETYISHCRLCLMNFVVCTLLPKSLLLTAMSVGTHFALCRTGFSVIMCSFLQNALDKRATERNQRHCCIVDGLSISSAVNDEDHSIGFLYPPCSMVQQTGIPRQIHQCHIRHPSLADLHISSHNCDDEWCHSHFSNCLSRVVCRR